MTIFTAISIWIISTILALPSVLFSQVKTEEIYLNRTIQYCWPFPDEYGDNYKEFIVLFRFFAYYLGPLCIISVFYILMARHLLLSTRNMPGEQQGQANQVRARKKVAKMVLAFVTIFFICFFPFHTFALWFHFYPNAFALYNEFWHAYRIIGFCLSFLNSCINPIALYCVSKAFRKHFNRYLLCWCHKETRSNEISLAQAHSSTRQGRQTSVNTTHYTISRSEKT